MADTRGIDATGVCPISWFSLLDASRVCLGPKLSTFKEREFLVRKMGVTHVACILNFSDDERLMRHHDMCTKAIDKDRHMEFIYHPLDMEKYTPQGQNKAAKDAHLANHFARHAQGIFKQLKNPESSFVYVHNKTGLDEEVYIAFALWAFLFGTDNAGDGLVPSAWIKANHYESLLDEDEDKLKILDMTWKKARELRAAEDFFKPKRAKIQK